MLSSEETIVDGRSDQTRLDDEAKRASEWPENTALPWRLGRTISSGSYSSTFLSQSTQTIELILVMVDIFKHETDCKEGGGNGCETKSQMEKAKTLWGLSLVRGPCGNRIFSFVANISRRLLSLLQSRAYHGPSCHPCFLCPSTHLGPSHVKALVPGR